MVKAAYIFPGQGSQETGMGRDLYERYPAAKSVFDNADKVLGFSLSSLCFEGDDKELAKTENAQPALLTMSIACLAAAREALAEKLPDASFVAGHSLGEYTALVAAETISFESGVLLTRARGQLMCEAEKLTDGAMAVVIGLPESEVAEACKKSGVWIANVNCPGQIVVSGESDKIKAATALVKANGAKIVIPLQVSGAFHTPLMLPAFEGLSRAITTHTICAPNIPIVSNVSAMPLTTPEGITNELKEQLYSCVQWQACVEYLVSQGVYTMIEFGCGSVLSGLIGRISNEVEVLNINDVESIESFTT